MLEVVATRHMSKKNISLNQCLFDEILDASQNMGIECEKKDDLHKPTQANRSYLHYRWW